jgi:hypothetical protein
MSTNAPTRVRGMSRPALHVQQAGGDNGRGQEFLREGEVVVLLEVAADPVHGNDAALILCAGLEHVCTLVLECEFTVIGAGFACHAIPPRES